MRTERASLHAVGVGLPARAQPGAMGDNCRYLLPRSSFCSFISSAVTGGPTCERTLAEGHGAANVFL